MLMMRTINTASTGLTISIKAVDEAEDKTTVHTEAVKGEYTKEINDIKKTKKQNFRKRDAISIIN
jgi:hypothetical protein